MSSRRRWTTTASPGSMVFGATTPRLIGISFPLTSPCSTGCRRCRSNAFDSSRGLALPSSFASTASSFLGFGVAIGVRSAALERLRSNARTEIGGEFSRQDSQPWKPHVTVQNKVTAVSARQLQYALEQGFAERVGAATGLLVWEYLGGPWKLVDRIAFTNTT